MSDSECVVLLSTIPISCHKSAPYHLAVLDDRVGWRVACIAMNKHRNRAYMENEENHSLARHSRFCELGWLVLAGLGCVTSATGNQILTRRLHGTYCVASLWIFSRTTSSSNGFSRIYRLFHEYEYPKHTYGTEEAEEEDEDTVDWRSYTRARAHL